jgi:hypothetical protein
MNSAAIRAAIEGRFAAQWVNNGQPRTPIGWDGHTFTAVKNSVRLTILDGEGRNASVGAPGSNVVRHAGVVAIQVFTEGGKGTAASRAYEDLIAAIFRNVTIDGIRFGVPYLGGSLEQAPFLIRTVMVPFNSDAFNG